MPQKKSESETDTHDDKSTVISELKGSEQHYDLKNQPGEDGDPNHANEDDPASPETRKMVKKAAKKSDEDTQIASALKDAAD